LHSRRVNRASLSLQTGILGVKRQQTIVNIDPSAGSIALARVSFRRISLSASIMGELTIIRKNMYFLALLQIASSFKNGN
jgi:hypothetical protein